MIDGLPEETARGITDSILSTMALVSGSIVLAAIVAGLLWFAARRARQPWDRRLRIAATIVGACTMVAAAAWVWFLIDL